MLTLGGRIALILVVSLAGTITALVWVPDLALRLAGVETVRFADIQLDLGTVEIDGIEIGDAGSPA